MSHLITISLSDEAATNELGTKLSAVMPTGTVLALDGTLGAGKTRLVQAIGQAVGIDPQTITSPTFTLVHQYSVSSNASAIKQPPSLIYHLDAYRVRDLEEFWELGIEEMFESDAWTIIEWSDRVRDCLPTDYLHVLLEVVSPDERRATITAVGEKYQSLVSAL